MIKTFQFLSLKASIALTIDSKPDLVRMFVEEFMPLFANRRDSDGTWVIDLLQINSPSLVQAIQEFVRVWKNRLPTIQGLPSFFRKLDPGEHFYLLPMIEVKRQLRFDLFHHLHALAEGTDLELKRSQFHEKFGAFVEQYSTYAFGIIRHAIGQPNKKRRSCRFCGMGMPDVTFDGKAHAISEALGNKTLTLYDECDGCNLRFSRTIEPSIVSIFSLFRTFFGVKGKGGEKVITGDGFKIRNVDGEVQIEITGDIARPEPGSSEYALNLPTRDPVVAQDLYRCLCKYFLSVIPESELGKFKRTIGWVNGASTFDELPRVAVLLNNDLFTEQPLLTTYLRITDDKSIPFAVGQFRFAIQTYLFIIPLSEEDDRPFTNEMDHSNFWNTFKHLTQSPGWDFRDLSDTKKRNITWSLRAKIEKKDNGDLC